MTAFIAGIALGFAIAHIAQSVRRTAAKTRERHEKEQAQ